MDQHWLTFMIHTFAKEYGWDKNQVDTIYPKEAVIYLKFISLQKKDETLTKQIDYYSDCIERLYITHPSNPEELKNHFSNTIETLKLVQLGVKSQIQTSDEASNIPNIQDDDLPDFAKWNSLKTFIQTQRG